jgi:lipoprotein-releasing system permease protein
VIFLALRYLLARRRQTLLTLLGIFFGTAAYVSISGFMLGFQGYTVDQLVNDNAHVLVQAREEFLTDHSLDRAFYGERYRHVFWDPAPAGRKDSAMVENPQSWYRRLKTDPRVVAYSPQLTAPVVFSNGKATTSTSVIGCDPIQQQKVTTIGTYVTEGRFGDIAAGGNRIAIGDELKKRLGVRISQNILVSLPVGTPTPFKVVAVFKTGNLITDRQAYGAIADVQKVNRTPNQVNQIAVRLRDYKLSARLADTWSAISLERVQSWDQLNSNIFTIFRIQDAVRYLTIGTILVVAGFGIYNVLNMTVVQKRKDIAILRSMGYGTGDIVWLFFSQGLLLASTGAVLGLSFGYVVCLYLQTVPFSASPMGAGSGFLHISFDPMIYVQATMLAFLAASIASILPARAAGKLAPIEIIRAGAE